MITRTNPAVDYLGADVFDGLAFCQSVRAGDTVYYAGVAPLKGTLETLELVGAGDMAAQFDYVLGVIDACLKADGLDRSKLVTWTFYTTDIKTFIEVMPGILGPWVGDHRPCSTTVEVRAFVHPDQLVEVTATAVDA
ncbi:RidA family protein [Zavarzinia sp.]|uniref:RidA family protein n=1 Tax=Zavarzinia sp. TaxID=2027920 RepID=UPI00356900D3